jgi:3-isopropylmalate dehydratase small subunit
VAEPFRIFTSKIVPIDAENVDTDQIVPARYLKVTDKAGLAEALFRDWRFEDDGSLKDPPISQGWPAGRSCSSATTSAPARPASMLHGR